LPGQVKRADQRERRLREAGGRDAPRPRTLSSTAARERRDVVGPIAQRRQIDAHGREPAIEVAAESDGRGRRRRSRAARWRQTNRGRDRHAVDAHLAVARDARQLRLRRGAQLGDVVQVERAAARRGDAAVGGTDSRSVARRAAGRRAGDRPLAASPSAQSRRHTAPTAPAALVQLAGDRFDARARLGGDERAASSARRGDQFLDAHDRRERPVSSTAPRWPVNRAALASASMKWICHGLTRFERSGYSFAPSPTEGDEACSDDEVIASRQ
jgi:hypothetical protein